MSDPFHIADDAGWLDMDEGREGLVAGRLDHVATAGFAISFPDGSGVSIECDDAGVLRAMLGSDIELEVVRTEDGLFATADAVTDAMVAHGTV